MDDVILSHPESHEIGHVTHGSPHVRVTRVSVPFGDVLDLVVKFWIAHFIVVVITSSLLAFGFLLLSSLGVAVLVGGVG